MHCVPGPYTVDPEIEAEFGQHLPTGATWGGGWIGVGHHDGPTEASGSRSDRGKHRRALGADGESVRGVLDIAAGEHVAVLALESGTHPEL